MKRAVVFTGLIREPDKFINFLKLYSVSFIDCRPQLYFSTWVGELSKYSVIKSMLDQLGCIIYEQSQPNLILNGHALHQIVALDIVLNSIGPDIYIFKTRPDFADFDLYKIFMSSEPEAISNCFLNNIGPKFKITVKGYSLSQPFYINDISFSGVSQDLKKITLLPFIAIIRYQKLQAEQLIWGGAVIPHVKIFDNYFKSFRLVADEKHSIANTHLLRKSKAYIYALAAYYLVLGSWFKTFYNSLSPISAISEFKLDELLWSDISHPSFYYNKSSFTNWSWDISIIKFILQENCILTDLGAEIKNALALLLANDNIEYYINRDLEVSIKEYSTSMHAITADDDKIVNIDGNLNYIKPVAPDWKIREANTYLESLEHQINFLRRQIDSLANNN